MSVTGNIERKSVVVVREDETYVPYVLKNYSGIFAFFKDVHNKDRKFSLNQLKKALGMWVTRKRLDVLVEENKLHKLCKDQENDTSMFSKNTRVLYYLPKSGSKRKRDQVEGPPANDGETLRKREKLVRKFVKQSHDEMKSWRAKRLEELKAKYEDEVNKLKNFQSTRMKELEFLMKSYNITQ